MKKIIAVFLCITMTTLSFAQDDMLNDLMKEQDTTTELLPKKMLLTQRVFWGEKGYGTGISEMDQHQHYKVRLIVIPIPVYLRQSFPYLISTAVLVL